MILFYLFFTCCAKAGDLSQEIRTYFSELGIEILSDGKAPIFKLETLQGDTLSLENFYGELLILHFWATWCKPCRREMPELEQLHRQLANKPVTILGISIDNENDGLKVENALKEINASFSNALSSSGKISKDYWAWGIPTSYFVDKEGRLLGRIRGNVEWTNSKMSELIHLLINKH
jgi:thiol-disulfide isomerase/thioredoxin